MKPVNAALARYGATIFDVMSGLARKHGAINLGQGFPEGEEPSDILAIAARALAEHSNQYPPMLGLPVLRQAIAAHDFAYYGLKPDPETGVMVTSGGTEALAAALLALIDPGDEVVLVEPLYDSYLPIIELAGGVGRLVRLSPPDWRLPLDALAAAFGPKTKAILFNSPMNPTAKLFSEAELSAIAALCIRHDCYAICDEVYEHLTFDGQAHRPLIGSPGMAERTVRIGSAGKSFSLTGWKVGYIVAGGGLVERICRAHQFLVFTTPPHLQHAVAYGLAKGKAYFDAFRTRMQGKRDRLVRGLEQAGFQMGPCAGTYFVTADIAAMGYGGSDVDFCREIIERCGVAAIPMSAFYAGTPLSSHVRFCFAKPDPMLDEAAARLAKRFGR